MNVLGLSKSPAPTAVLFIHCEDGRPERRPALDRRVRVAGSPIPDFMRSSGDLRAPPERITRPFGASDIVVMVPETFARTPVAALPVRKTRWTQVPDWRWKLGRVRAVCR